MKTTTLLFNSKTQLLEFYYTLGSVAFAVDLNKLALTSSFSPTDLLSAVKKYDARILTRNSLQPVAEETWN